MVNEWVAEQTDDFIPSIIDSFSTETVFALLNTIFLDAGWRDEYRELGETVFNTLDGTTVLVESFGGVAPLGLQVLRSDDLIAIEIPYGGGDITMLIFMPQSIADFETSLDAETVENLVDAMRIDCKRHMNHRVTQLGIFQGSS